MKKDINDVTWSRLCERQLSLVKEKACGEFIKGWEKLALSTEHLPDLEDVSAKLCGITGWSLSNAENEYLTRDEWFRHIVEKRFPVTDFIRKPEDLDFTPLPDLFHEYFGHLAFLTDQNFTNLLERFGKLYNMVKTEQQRIEIQRIWWFSIEFGLILENGQEKVLGAGLLSSPGEFVHADSAKRANFSLEEIIKTPLMVNGFHQKYFVLKNLSQINQALDEYANSLKIVLAQ